MDIAMNISVLRAKLHQVRVSQVELEYEGSCAIDGHLLDLSGIHEYEQIQIYNLNNGDRLTTYAIRAENHSRTISINGAAARRAAVGDRVIICAYADIEASAAKNFKPTILHFNDNNEVKQLTHSTPVQVVR